MADDDPIRARMASLTDDELRLVVTVEKDHWEPEALEVAQQELLRRGVLIVSEVDAEEAQKRVRPPLGLKAGGGFLLAAVIVKVILMLLRHW